MTMKSMEEYRKFLKSDLWNEWSQVPTDQRKGLPHPPHQKPAPEGAERIDLVSHAELSVGSMPLNVVIDRRRSRRSYTDEALTLEELSFLLWATQGVREIARGGVSAMRTVPSAGARHPFETYLAVQRVDGLAAGLYRYLPLDHALVKLREDAGLASRVARGCNSQMFVAQAAVTFIWTVIPYRSEWRYSFISHKVIAIDVGHLCQNLYLASEAIGAGACGIAAYEQAEMDRIMGVDGVEEFTIYVAPVGKIE
jgi:SagB-type dehydrogenase family enzyme